MFFVCEYGDNYIHEIWAETEADAKSIAKRFNFSLPRPTKKTPSEYRPSRLAQHPGGLNRDDVLHSLCFLTFLAQRIGIIGPDESCGDNSALHSLIHFRQIGSLDPFKFKKRIARGIHFLETNIPGIPPPFIFLQPLILHHGPAHDLNEPFTVESWL